MTNKTRTFTIIAISIDKDGNVTSHKETITTTMKIARTLLNQAGSMATTAFLLYKGELICKVGV